jgi:hypothetical protein
MQLNFQIIIAQDNVGQQRFLHVFAIDVPSRADPGKFPVNPDAKVVRMPNSLILLPDVRVVNVANSIIRIEVDQYSAVAYWQVSWHTISPTKQPTEIIIPGNLSFKTRILLRISIRANNCGGVLLPGLAGSARQSERLPRLVRVLRNAGDAEEKLDG